MIQSSIIHKGLPRKQKKQKISSSPFLFAAFFYLSDVKSVMSLIIFLVATAKTLNGILHSGVMVLSFPQAQA